VAAAVIVPPTTMAAPATPPPTTAPPAGPGQMQVVVKPWGEVTVDGRMVGTTPLDRLTLSAGPHAVVVRHPLYEPWEGRVTVRAGQTERVVVDFPAQGRRRQ
jgi:serine/threonine-protein kinase